MMWIYRSNFEWQQETNLFEAEKNLKVVGIIIMIGM